MITRALVGAFALFAAGALTGAGSIHTAYTAKTVSHIEPEGARQYSAADRRDMRNQINLILARERKRSTR